MVVPVVDHETIVAIPFEPPALNQRPHELLRLSRFPTDRLGNVLVGMTPDVTAAGVGGGEVPQYFEESDGGVTWDLQLVRELVDLRVLRCSALHEATLLGM